MTLPNSFNYYLLLSFSQTSFGFQKLDCMMGRPPCCDEVGVKKGPWTTEEDQKLVDYIARNGHGSWRALPKLAGLNRCGKSCRSGGPITCALISRGKFSDEEERQIIELHSLLGNKWSAIATHLDGRTDNEIKNYWNTHIRKKLIQMGIDPVTHRPRPDLSLLANLPNLLASAANSSAPLDGGTLRMQTDAAQLAGVQLFQTLLQVLTATGCGGGGGGCVSSAGAFNDQFSSANFTGSSSGFLHNNNYGGLLNMGQYSGGNHPEVLPLIQTTDHLDHNPFTNIGDGGGGAYSNSTMLFSEQMENTNQYLSMPSLVSSSPEINAAVISAAEDRAKLDQQRQNNIMPTNPSASISMSSTACDSFDLVHGIDLSGDLYWKEVFNHASSPSWPFQS